MKKLLPILLLLSCSKQIEKPVTPANQFTASVSLYPNEKTVSYDFFVSSDTVKNENKIWIWVARKVKYEVKGNPFSFGFDIVPFVCNGVTYPDMSNKLSGAVRETIVGNIQKELEFNVTIK